jgi:hypothetical protein
MASSQIPHGLLRPQANLPRDKNENKRQLQIATSAKTYADAVCRMAAESAILQLSVERKDNLILHLHFTS